jgi:hypothetical protein
MNGSPGSSGVDLIARLMAVLTVCIALLVGTMTVWMLQDCRKAGGVRPGEGSLPEVIECDLSVPDGKDCPAGAVCMQNVCEHVDDDTRICGEGEGCDANSCECDAGLVCHQHVCARRSVENSQPRECRNPAVRRAVERLQIKCAAQRSKIDAVRGRGSCNGKEWGEIAFADPEFFTMLSVFNVRFTVHFPMNMPDAGGPWPTVTEHAYYRQQIERMRGPLTRATWIFIIGRASPDGSYHANYTLSTQRMDMILRLVSEVIRGDTPRNLWMPLPILPWPQATTKKDWIDSKTFHKKYRSPAIQEEYGVSSIIASTPEETERIERLLDASIKGVLVDDADRKYLAGALNRLVLVVASDCEVDAGEDAS